MVEKENGFGGSTTGICPNRLFVVVKNIAKIKKHLLFLLIIFSK
jgi:hypothetical protein